MGRIKEEIIPKPQRGKTESKPPSVRRARRQFMQGKFVTMKNGDSVMKKLLRPQYIPATVILKLKKKYRPTVSIDHGHDSDGEMIRSEQVVKQLTAPLSSAFARDLRQFAADGQGVLSFIKGRTIWHRQGV